MRQYYSERYNRDVQVHNLKIKLQKLRKNLLILENFSSQNILATR